MVNNYVVTSTLRQVLKESMVVLVKIYIYIYTKPPECVDMIHHTS